MKSMEIADLHNTQEDSSWGTTVDASDMDSISSHQVSIAHPRILVTLYSRCEDFSSNFERSDPSLPISPIKPSTFSSSLCQTNRAKTKLHSTQELAKMKNHITVIIPLLLTIAASLASSDTQGVEEVGNWFNNLAYKTQKATHLHFYLHDIITGKNPTAIKVADSPLSKKFQSGFGFINVADDKITVGPDPTSKELGRAQGIYGSSDQKERAFITELNFVFTAGDFNGSTLSMLGRNPILQKNHELPIVGGTGVFRLARGSAVLNTIKRDPVTRNAVVEYDIFVLHY